MFFVSGIELEECSLLPSDRRYCRNVLIVVFLEYVLVVVGAALIYNCVWKPKNTFTTTDFEKLAYISYLYDYEACEHKTVQKKNIKTVKVLIKVGEFTDVKPLKPLDANVSVSTTLSQLTRNYLDKSIAINSIWLLTAIALWIFSRPASINVRILNIVIMVFFLTTIAVIMFDLSMGLVYITHIKQSLSNAMVLRYSGWSLEMTLNKPDDFAGWLPMAASLVWLRGVIILVYNIYCCKRIHQLRRKLQRREIKQRLDVEENVPFPPPSPGWRSRNREILLYRPGEREPQLGYDERF